MIPDIFFNYDDFFFLLVKLFLHSFSLSHLVRGHVHVRHFPSGRGFYSVSDIPIQAIELSVCWKSAVLLAKCS